MTIRHKGIQFFPITVRWACKPSEDWVQLVERRGKRSKLTHTDPACEVPDPIFVGPVRVGSEPPLVADFLATPPHEGDDWKVRLIVRHRPSTEPPKPVLEAEEKAEGERGLFELVDRAREDAARPIARYVLEVTLDEKVWRSNIIPRKAAPGTPDAPALDIGDAVVEQFGYRFHSGAAGIEEVSCMYAHEDRVYSVVLVARTALHMTSDFRFPAMEDACDLLTGRLFTRVEKIEVEAEHA